MRRSRQRGIMLGVVLVLLIVLLAAALFAFWTVRGDSGAAGRDHLSRQLFDCAEQGLAAGKQYFSTGTARNNWSTYLNANICSTSVPNLGTLPCWTAGGPFPTGATGTVTGYPDLSPFTVTITPDPRTTNQMQYTFAMYNDPADSSPYSDSNNQIVVYARCIDLTTKLTRTVEQLIKVPAQTQSDYTGQAGRGFRNQGNQNF